jgi:hypothetical protein
MAGRVLEAGVSAKLASAGQFIITQDLRGRSAKKLR